MLLWSCCCGPWILLGFSDRKVLPFAPRDGSLSGGPDCFQARDLFLRRGVGGLGGGVGRLSRKLCRLSCGCRCLGLAIGGLSYRVGRRGLSPSVGSVSHSVGCESCGVACVKFGAGRPRGSVGSLNSELDCLSRELGSASLAVGCLDRGGKGLIRKVGSLIRAALNKFAKQLETITFSYFA